MRKALIALSVIAVLLVAGDTLLRKWAEGRAAEQLETRLDLEQEPDVQLKGFPFFLSALAGRFSEVRVETGPVATGRARLQDVHLDLRNVEVSFGDAVGGDAGAVRTGGGTGRGFIGSGALNEALAAQGAPITLELSRGRALVSSPQLPGQVEGQLRLDGNRLSITAPGAPEVFSVRLPRVIGGISYQGVAIENDTLWLDFVIASGVLRAPR
jgi:hypothetical protein